MLDVGTNQDADYLHRFLRSYASQPGVALLRAVEASLICSLRLEPPILDIGCGDGKFAECLGRHLTVGLDSAPAELNYAKKTGVYSYLVQADACQMSPFPVNSFRTVFSNSVFEHIPLVDSAIDEVYRILSPGGYFAITVPTDKYGSNTLVSTLLRRIGAAASAARYERSLDTRFMHYHRLTPEEWRRKLEAHGFKVVEQRLYWSPRTTQVWNFLDILMGIGFGKYTIGAVIDHFPGRIQSIPVFLFHKMLRNVFRDDLAFPTSGGSACFLVATKEI